MKTFLPRWYQANIAHCAAAEVQKTSPFVMVSTGKFVSKTIRTERIETKTQNAENNVLGSTVCHDRQQIQILC